MKARIKGILFSTNVKVTFASLVIGIGGGIFSYALHNIVHDLSSLLQTNQAFTLYTLLVSGCLAALSLFLSKTIFKDTQGSGIPQVKLALVVHKGRFPKRMPFGKFIVSCLTLVSGMTFGKEGPLVTINAAWAHLVSHVLKLNQQLTRVLVASGAAAGLASAFNTPIAAVIFTIEEILGELKTKYLGFVILTAVIGSVTAFKLNGNISTFTPVHYKFKIEWHLIFYFALGLIMALKGVYFIRLIIFFKDFKKKYFKNEYLYIFFVLTLIALASNFTVEVLGDGVDTINRLLLGSEMLNAKSLILLLILRFFFSTTSYSTGLSGGLFMPVLLLGALGGNLIGLLLVQLGVEGVQVGAFTLLGMTSLLVAVIRTPFTAFVLLFEMTLDYELILPLMVSSISAFWIASKLSPSSVYEKVSAYEGVHLPTAADSEIMDEMSVEECMVTNVKSLDGNKTIEENYKEVEDLEYQGFPILINGRYFGVINIFNLKKEFEENPKRLTKEVKQFSVAYVFPDQSLLVAMDKMKKANLGRLPVVNRFNQSQLVGIITPEDIVSYLGITKE